MAFLKNCDLQQHTRTHTGEKPYPCNHCDKAFSRKIQLKSHMSTHIFYEHPLPKYNQHISSLSIYHGKFIHDKQLVETIQHLEKHAGKAPHQCSHCAKIQSKKSDFERHLRSHTGKKPYQCNQCDKAYSRKSDCDKHLLTHTGNKSYHCSQC